MRRFGITIMTAGLIGLCGTSAEGTTGVRVQGPRIIMETEHVAYEIGRDGLSKSFKYLETGKDRLDASVRVPFMAVEKNGQWFGATAVEFSGGVLDVTFGDGGIRAKVRAQARANYLTLELTELSDQEISRLHLVRVPLNITQTVGNSLAHCRDDEHAAALIALNEETHSYATPLEQTAPGDSPR